MIPLPWVRDPIDPSRWTLNLPRQGYVLVDFTLRDGVPYSAESGNPWQGVRLMNGGCVVGWIGAGHWPDVWTAIVDIDAPMRERLAGIADRVYGDAEALVADVAALREAVA